MGETEGLDPPVTSCIHQTGPQLFPGPGSSNASVTGRKTELNEEPEVSHPIAARHGTCSTVRMGGGNFLIHISFVLAFNTLSTIMYFKIWILNLPVPSPFHCQI